MVADHDKDVAFVHQLRGFAMNGTIDCQDFCEEAIRPEAAHGVFGGSGALLTGIEISRYSCVLAVKQVAVEPGERNNN